MVERQRRPLSKVRLSLRRFRTGAQHAASQHHRQQ
jgi:hypothetical protein